MGWVGLWQTKKFGFGSWDKIPTLTDFFEGSLNILLRNVLALLGKFNIALQSENIRVFTFSSGNFLTIYQCDGSNKTYYPWTSVSFRTNTSIFRLLWNLNENPNSICGPDGDWPPNDDLLLQRTEIFGPNQTCRRCCLLILTSQSSGRPPTVYLRISVTIHISYFWHFVRFGAVCLSRPGVFMIIKISSSVNLLNILILKNCVESRNRNQETHWALSALLIMELLPSNSQKMHPGSKVAE